MQFFSLLDKIPSFLLFSWYPITQYAIHNFKTGYNKLKANKQSIAKEFPTAKSFAKKHIYTGPDFSFESFAKDLIEKIELNQNKKLSQKEKNEFFKVWTETIPKNFPEASNFIEDLFSNNNCENPTENGLLKELISFSFKNNGYKETQATLTNMLKNQVPTSINSACRVGLGSYSMYCAIARERKTNNITNYLHTQLIATSQIIRSMKECSQAIKNNPILTQGLAHHQDLHNLFDKKSTKVSYKLHRLVELLLTDTFKEDASYFSIKGRVLAAYSLMQDVKEELAPALRALGEIDTLLATTKLYRSFENERVSYTFPTYLNKQHPEITLIDMWNPFVSTEKTVTNSVEIGNTKPNNIILTGPNAGGKSTFLKGTALSILLAQTIGISPARELVFTPFAKINTYMNVTDDTAGGNSLFKSEVLRAQELLKSVENLNTHNFSLSIMDEMFSGTSPKEGEAASFGVAKRLGRINNSILLLASHFPKLQRLEKETKNFKNYKVRVARHDNGTFSYPFKLEEGAADQNVAIDILKEQGFNSSILDDAEALLNE